MFRIFILILLVFSGASSTADDSRRATLEEILQTVATRVTVHPDRTKIRYERIPTILARCDLSSAGMDWVDQVLAAFWDSKGSQFYSYDQFAKGLRSIEMSDDQRVQLLTVGFYSAELTLRRLREQSCRAFIRYQLELGLSASELLQQIKKMP